MTAKEPIFTKLKLARIVSAKNSCTEFHENSTLILGHRRVDMRRSFFFYLGSNA